MKSLLKVAQGASEVVHGVVHILTARAATKRFKKMIGKCYIEDERFLNGSKYSMITGVDSSMGWAETLQVSVFDKHASVCAGLVFSEYDFDQKENPPQEISREQFIEQCDRVRAMLDISGVLS